VIVLGAIMLLRKRRFETPQLRQAKMTGSGDKRARSTESVKGTPGQRVLARQRPEPQTVLVVEYTRVFRRTRVRTPQSALGFGHKQVYLQSRILG
jgi:hypothetical protein